MRSILALTIALFLPATALADSLGGNSAGNPGPPANSSSLNGCVYNSSAPTATSGQQIGAQCDINGNLKTTASLSAASLNPATHAQCSALCANLVVKASAGNLYTFEVNADATLSAAAWYVMIFDATSAPADGAVTPAKCYGIPSGTTQMGGTFTTAGVAFTSGITVSATSTGCLSKTASTHAFIAADFQ